MSQKTPDNCPYLNIKTNNLLAEQNVIVIGEDGEIPNEISTYPIVPECHSPIVMAKRTRVMTERTGIQKVALQTLDSYCRGNHDQCEGYELAVYDSETKLKKLKELLENDQIRTTIKLDERINESDLLKLAIIKVDVELTENENTFFIRMYNFRKFYGNNLDVMDINSPNKKTSERTLAEIQSGESIVIHVDKNTGSVEYSEGEKIAGYLGMKEFYCPLYERVNLILNQMLKD